MIMKYDGLRYCNGVVVFLDRLGSKGMGDQYDLYEIVKGYHDLNRVITNFVEKFQDNHDGLVKKMAYSLRQGWLPSLTLSLLPLNPYSKTKRWKITTYEILLLHQ